MPFEKGLEAAVFWEYSWNNFFNYLFTNPVCVNIKMLHIISNNERIREVLQIWIV